MDPRLLEAFALRALPVAGLAAGELPDLGSLLVGLRDRRGLAALDSAAGSPADWSWVAFEPREELPSLPAELAALDDWLAAAPRLGGSVPGPFAGGFLGALGYDAGAPGEEQSLPPDPWGQPALVGGLYTRFFVFDHRERRLHLVLDPAAEIERAGLEELARRALAAPAQPRRTVAGPLERLVPGARHRERVETARRLIHAGELYQANLAHPFEAELDGDPLDLYLRLREENPAPYMGYLRWAGGAILSASPELLLEVEGRDLRTRPIKGTAPRGATREEDERRARELHASEKDRAELAMIVDLMRNDLGRVAEIGSVRVESAWPRLRSYEGLHHLMADVHGQLAEGRSALDALAACFPAGSITGAPKLRAMEVIARLEGRGRGFFCGSLGFLDRRGNARFNVLIRTIEWRPEPAQGAGAGRVRYQVGGGITFASDAEAEERETLLKGARLAGVLGARVPGKGEPEAWDGAL